MSDITAAQARDIYNNLETWIVTILKAQSDITDLLGETGGNPAIEDGLRNEFRLYMNEEVPALAVLSAGSSDEDAEGEGQHTEIVGIYNMVIFTLNHGADLKETKNKVQQVAAEVSHYLRTQINSTDDLSQEIGGSANAIIKVGSTTFEIEQDEEAQIFQVLGRTLITVTLDMDVD